ncbi:hypothetical protein I4U23_002242 [Adineta vaga]|nr:hypothetical protein I4U23_002242 [Adineta vaga]
MSLNNESIPRNKPFARDIDPQRIRMPINDSHILNLPPPPQPTTTYSSFTVRPSAIPGNFNIPPPPPLSVSTSSMLNDTMSTFNKERLHDVLQQGLGTYVYIEHFGLVPKLNHF